jgi:hypothetical protein
LLKTKVRLDFLVNPFYLYPLSFSIVIIFYLFGWSDLFPKLTTGLVCFFIISFAVFLLIGYKYQSLIQKVVTVSYKPFLNDIIFWFIISLGVINILLMGYIPLFNRTYNYREFGFPVIDPVFNSLCIFFSAFFLQTFLNNKNRKLLLYFFVLFTFQIFLFRRSTMVWILTSSSFLLVSHYVRINLAVIGLVFILIPLFSFIFGLYGNYRGNLSSSFIIDDLKASESYKKTGIGPNHYITYLYMSSPLANLQQNINNEKSSHNFQDFKSMLFNSIIPESITMRIGKTMNLESPKTTLIHPELLAGTFLLLSYSTMGWIGMILMMVYLLIFILICLWLYNKYEIFKTSALSILATAVSLLVFGNFLNRLDVILMLVVYPVCFYYVYSIGGNKVQMVKSVL